MRHGAARYEPRVIYRASTALNAAPVVKAVFEAWKEKRDRPAAPPLNFRMK